MAPLRRSRTEDGSGYPRLKFRPKAQRARYVHIRDQMVIAGIEVENIETHFPPMWSLDTDWGSIIILRKSAKIPSEETHHFRKTFATIDQDGRVSLRVEENTVYVEENPGDLTMPTILEFLDRSADVGGQFGWTDLRLRGEYTTRSVPDLVPGLAKARPSDAAWKGGSRLDVDAAWEIVDVNEDEEDAYLAETGMGVDPDTGVTEMLHLTVRFPKPHDFYTGVIPLAEPERSLCRTDTVDRVDLSLRLGIRHTSDGGEGSAPAPHAAYQVVALSGTHQGESVFGLRTRPGPRTSADIGIGLDIDDALASHFIGSGYSRRLYGCFEYHSTPAGDAIIMRRTLRALLSGLVLRGIPTPPGEKEPTTHLTDNPDSVGSKLGLWCTDAGLNYDYTRDFLGMGVVPASGRLWIDLP